MCVEECENCPSVRELLPFTEVIADVIVECERQVGKSITSMSATARPVRMALVGDTMFLRVKTMIFRTLAVIPKRQTMKLRKRRSLRNSAHLCALQRQPEMEIDLDRKTEAWAN
ncbi:hypothetical protein CEXT_299191, partial [Caerostris extrusa]